MRVASIEFAKTYMDIDETEDPFMKKVRQLDKMADELARGKAFEKILEMK